MKKLVIICFLFLNFYINCEIATGTCPGENQKKETKDNENNSNSLENTSNIDFDRLFEIENLPPPKLEEPSTVKVWIRKYGLAFVYKIYDLKNWIINRCKKLFVKKNKIMEI